MIPGTKNPVRTISGTGSRISFDPKGTFVFGLQDSGLAQWDLIDENIQPVVFRSPDSPGPVIFDKQDRWIATAAGATLTFYPARRSHPYVYRSAGIASNSFFTPDGKSPMTGSSVEGIRVWNLPGEKPSQPQTIWNSKIWNANSIDVDPSGKYVLAATENGVHMISILDGNDLALESRLLAGSYEYAVFSPDGKSAAAAGVRGIQIWDLHSGESRILEKETAFSRLKYSADGSLISGDQTGKLCRWNLNDDSARVLDPGKGSRVAAIAISKDGRYLAAITSSAKNIFELQKSTSELVLYDLKSGKSSLITSHGNRVFCVAFDPGGTRLVTGDLDGIVRVGPMTGETPHLLLGHGTTVHDVVVHPGGQWIASTASDSVIRLWQMPQGKPLNSLPYNEFLNHLRAMTNVRAVANTNSPSGYELQYQPLSGWAKIQN